MKKLFLIVTSAYLFITTSICTSGFASNKDSVLIADSVKEAGTLTKDSTNIIKDVETAEPTLDEAVQKAVPLLPAAVTGGLLVAIANWLLRWNKKRIDRKEHKKIVQAEAKNKVWPNLKK